MQQYSHPPDKEGATNVELPDPAVDLAFLQEFLGEGLDINDTILPANDLFDPVSGDLSQMASFLAADFGAGLSAAAPFQGNFQHQDESFQPQQGQRPQYQQDVADAQLTPSQAAGSGEDTRGGESQGEHARKQYRSGRQQELNKAAQVRYRQRKKSRAEELRAAVAALNERIQELSVQQQEHAELHARHEQLQQAVRQHEQQSSPGLASGLSLEAGSDCAPPAHGPGSLRPEEDPQDAEGHNEDTLQHRQERLHDVVLLLRKGIEIGWSSEEPKEAAGHQAAYDRLLQEAIDLFVSTSSPAGLEDAATARCEGPAAASSPDRSWLNAQNALCLSPSQLQSLLQLRAEHMLKEEALAERKLSVRRKALELLQQAQAGSSASTHQDFFGRLQARSSLSSIVRELRAVLREEAKSREDTARALLQHVLRPTQAASLLIAVHPAPCDVTMLWQLLLKAPCSQIPDKVIAGLS